MVDQVPEAQTVEAAALSGTTPLVPGTQPTLLPTQVLAGRGPGLLYRIEGELLPALHVALDGSTPVMFENHVLFWKQPQVDVRMRKMKGTFKRMISGMPIFMTEATGEGQIAFPATIQGTSSPCTSPPIKPCSSGKTSSWRPPRTSTSPTSGPAAGGA